MYWREKPISSPENISRQQPRVCRRTGAAARSSRLEKDGAYDPDRIIRIQDYVEDGTIYDDMPESEKGNGLCYRLGDLYQWSLKGAIVSNKVLNEAYKPLFFGSIQEYANQYDEEYNVLVKQIEDSLEKLQQDVTAYQQDQKNWPWSPPMYVMPCMIWETDRSTPMQELFAE